MSKYMNWRVFWQALAILSAPVWIAAAIAVFIVIVFQFPLWVSTCLLLTSIIGTSLYIGFRERNKK